MSIGYVKINGNTIGGGGGGTSTPSDPTVLGLEGTIISNGQLCYLSTDSKWYICDNRVRETCVGLLGIRKRSGVFQISGTYAFPSLLTGATYFVGQGGQIVSEVVGSSSVTRMVGYASSPTLLVLTNSQENISSGSLDGGSADSVYLLAQHVDGGSANG